MARRTGQHPGVYLIYGGFATSEDITALEKLGVTVFTVYTPVKLPRNKPEEESYQPHPPQADPQVVKWRQRMSTDEAKAVYRLRAATAEWTNPPEADVVMGSSPSPCAGSSASGGSVPSCW